MNIKGTEINVKEIAKEQSPYRQDYTEMFLKGTAKDPSLTVVCYSRTEGDLPTEFTANGDENFNPEVFDEEYKKILFNTFGDLSEEEMPVKPLVFKSTGYWILSALTARIIFYRGRLYEVV